MLKKLSNEASECLRRAADCRRKADEAKISTAKEEFLEMERRWRFLARSYELTQRLTDFSAYGTKRNTNEGDRHS